MSLKEELLGFLNKSMTKFENVVNNIKEEDLNIQIQDKEGGWTVIELLRHIQNSERGMTFQAKSILEGNVGAAEDFDLKRYNARSTEKMANLTLNEVKANMTKYRQETIALLNSVKDDQWNIEGRHPNLNVYSIKQFFEIISWHQQHHLKVIREKFNL